MEALVTIRPELLTIHPDQWEALKPLMWALGGVALAMIASVLRRFNPKWLVLFISLCAVLGGSIAAGIGLPLSPVYIFNEGYVVDGLANLFTILFLSSAGVTILTSFKYLDREGLQYPEYNILILFSAIGMMLMVSAVNLIVMFIALEIMSLSVYVLVGFRRADRRSNEASMKYFILGSAASAILLYGIALLYGATGTVSLRGISSFVQHNAQLSPLFVMGVGLSMVGFLFKVAAVPFHMWMPDVYEGALAPITGFMTTGLKAASFAALLRFFISLGYGKGLSFQVQDHLRDILWLCAVLTMVVGNVVALTQTNLKRMLAYSSIAHTGYLIIGIFVGAKSGQGYSGLVFYLVSYALMNLGAFAVLSAISTRGDGGLNLHNLSGLSQKHPFLAFAMAVFMLSMAGIPPTAGFYAKYLLFYSAIEAGEISIVVIGVLCSAISVYYYLRVLVCMYMKDAADSVPITRVSAWSTLAVASMVALTVQLGVLPARMVNVAKKVVQNL
ncbi:MAG: NADH-quinone oxidoreductase subunit N [Bdellovibrionota bacterium]